MDPAIAALDFAKAGAILADKVESFLAAGTTPQPPEGADHDDDGNKDLRTAPVASGVHLHSPVDTGTSPLQKPLPTFASDPDPAGNVLQRRLKV
jgi:hypothetical protein